MKTKNKRTRHERYKPGIFKMTVTVDNDDYVRAKRQAVRQEFKDTSAWLRSLIHEAVWDEVLTTEDYEELKALRQKQEV